MPMQPFVPTNSAFTFEGLVASIGHAHAALAQQATKAVNISLTLRNWSIGFYIAEFQLQGANRAEYGDRLIPTLAEALRSKNVSNTARRQLYSYLELYRAYPQIVRTNSAQSTRLFPLPLSEQKVPTLSALSDSMSEIDPETLVSELSYSHFQLLVELSAPVKRRFYEAETLRGNWPVRELKRQIDTQYYERSARTPRAGRICPGRHEQQPLCIALPGGITRQGRNRCFSASSRARTGRPQPRLNDAQTA